MPSSSSKPTRISLFVTCLVDSLYPQVGIATVNLLERLGFEVDFPSEQVCCGQPAFNSGFPDEARKVARPLLDAFVSAETIVCPSGSCAAMLRHHLSELFVADDRLRDKALALSKKVYELSEFLVNVAGITDTGSAFTGTAVYHPSCHLMREQGVDEEPERLLQAVTGLTMLPLEDRNECCGFGGSFAIKQPRLSGEMTCAKARAVVASGAEMVVSGDVGCLMNVGGALQRSGSPVRMVHLAELLEPAR